MRAAELSRPGLSCQSKSFFSFNYVSRRAMLQMSSYTVRGVPGAQFTPVVCVPQKDRIACWPKFASVLMPRHLLSICSLCSQHKCGLWVPGGVRGPRAYAACTYMHAPLAISFPNWLCVCFTLCLVQIRLQHRADQPQQISIV